MSTLKQVIEGLRSDPSTILTPAYAEISLMGRCNFTCIQCHQLHHMQQDMELHGGVGATRLRHDRTLRLLEELRDLEVSTVELCGRGEPTLYPQLPEVITAVKDHGMQGTLITNGVRLTGPAANAIASSGFDEVSISLYGATEETYAQITRTRAAGTLNRIIENIHALHAQAPRTKLTVVFLLQPEILPGLVEMIELMHRLPAE